ncbi:hypothetical protein ACGFXC_07445 [Streptomyces sp. NPDC048507]|uniref:hypothetical protein n=1 Tax=Streptomyces sp. NPDC048507 TaxID=3365560 RepID=UPI003722A808
MTTPPPTPEPTPDTATAPDNAPPPAGTGPAPDGGAGAVPRPGGRGVGVAWVRTRLRAMPMAAVLAAALAFVAVLLAAALPRALDRGADDALRAFLRQQGPAPTSLYASARPVPGQRTPQALDSVLEALRARTGPGTGIDLAPTGPVHGTVTLTPRALTNPELRQMPGDPPPPTLLNLLHLPRMTSHARIVEGHWPGAAAEGAPLPVALAKSAADTLDAKVGTVLRTSPGVGTPFLAEVVGLYTADDPADPYWTGLPCPTAACLSPSWRVTAVTGAEGLERFGSWGGSVQDFWRLPLDTGTLRADRLPAVSAAVSSYVAGPTATALRRTTDRVELQITSDLPRLFAQAQARQQAAAPLAALGPAGLAGEALVVLCLAAGLGADRRTAELLLLRARGASRWGVLRRLLAEGAVTVLPAAALATALAVALLPVPRLAPTLLAAGAVTLLVLLAFPVRALVLLSGPGGAAPRRRLVGELLVLAATVAAVVQVGRRGVAPAGAGPDPLLVAAPLLMALCGGLLLARVLPLLVRALSRAAGRGRGVIGFLGLARAARGGGGGGSSHPSLLPLTALLLAVTTGGFGATVLDSVDTSRHQVARAAVGGDAAVTAPPQATLPAEFTRAAAALPGVRTSVPVWIDTWGIVLGTSQQGTQVTVIVADPQTYAELSGAVGRGRFDPAVLAGGTGGGDAPLPALFGRALAAQVTGGGVQELRFGDGTTLPVRAAAVIDGTPALPGGGTLTMVLPAGPTAVRLPRAERPTHWFGLGSVEEAPLRGLLDASVPKGDAAQYLVRTSAGAADRLAHDPLQASAARLFWGSLAGAAAFALLAVLLNLLRAAPERAALLARLRTMGLRPRQGLALILAESLPQALAAALGGGLVAAAAVALLGPSVDLSTLVGSAVPTGVRLTVRPLLTLTLGLAALLALAVFAEAAVSGRRQITTELRAGDPR